MSGKFTDTELKAFEKLINSLADEVGQAIKHFGEFAEDAKAQIAFDWKHTDGKTYKRLIS